MTISNGRPALSKAQFKVVEAAALKEQVVLGRVPVAPDAPDFVWQENHILVDGAAPLSHPELAHLSPTLPTNRDGSPQLERAGRVKLVKINGNARATVEALRTSPTFTWFVGLNELVSICPVNLCPADEPIPTRRWPHTVPYPAWDQGGTGGAGISVEVIDTGLADGWMVDHPWLYDGSGSVTAQQLNTVSGDPGPTFEPDGDIELYAGHGEFIAGVLRCVAPRARVKVSNALRWAGAMTEFELRDVLMTALDRKPNIISLSAGCLPLDNQPPQALKEVVDRMRDDPQCTTLLVAAAGNDGGSKKFFPAGFAGNPAYRDVVVSVGALRTDGLGRACFSNFGDSGDSTFGDWVSVYADGERLVNAFPIGRYVYYEPLSTYGYPPKPECIYHPGLYSGCTCVTAFAEGTVIRFDGMAVWSGTSFATPIVAARIAKQMANPATPTARSAWQALRGALRTFTDAGDKITSLRALP